VTPSPVPHRHGLAGKPRPSIRSGPFRGPWVGPCAFEASLQACHLAGSPRGTQCCVRFSRLGNAGSAAARRPARAPGKRRHVRCLIQPIRGIIDREREAATDRDRRPARAAYYHPPDHVAISRATTAAFFSSRRCFGGPAPESVRVSYATNGFADVFPGLVCGWPVAPEASSTALDPDLVRDRSLT